jgi:hypothetical protein
MNRHVVAGLAAVWLGMAGASQAQQRPVDAPPLVEAKKEQVVYALGGQLWEFKQILTAYEPIKGVFEPLTNEAIWTLQLVKDFQPGEVGLQRELAGSPFRPVLLDADRGVIAADAPVEISEITGKQGDTIRMIVHLPDEEILAQVKTIRIERRTQVGF